VDVVPRARICCPPAFTTAKRAEPNATKELGTVPSVDSLMEPPPSRSVRTSLNVIVLFLISRPSITPVARP
jgi:hypothetical protein